MAEFTVYRSRFSEKASGRFQVSHGNELSSRVEMRHRADAVFHVSIPYVRSRAWNYSCTFPDYSRACVYVRLNEFILLFIFSASSQIPFYDYVRDTRARNASRKIPDKKGSIVSHTRDENVFMYLTRSTRYGSWSTKDSDPRFDVANRFLQRSLRTALLSVDQPPLYTRTRARRIESR